MRALLLPVPVPVLLTYYMANLVNASGRVVRSNRNGPHNASAIRHAAERLPAFLSRLARLRTSLFNPDTRGSVELNKGKASTNIRFSA